ncbi:MAG: glycoside hydrolase family 104 protein, partial [Flavobacterium sp.]
MLFEVLPPDVKVDTSGAIQATLKWDRISEKLPSRAVYAVVQDSEDIILYNGVKTNGGVAITKKSALLGLAEYKSAVLVGKAGSSKKDNKNGICEAEARVRAFMRMLKVGEGTGELIKSWDNKTNDIIYIKNDFEKSYTTAFGGNKILDLSDHPKKNYGGSTAAGAYQIMEYTYAWLGGSKLEWRGKYFKILDVYESYHDYRKKYNITDFQPESQDKLCICLMKDKKGLIELIVDNKIENAIRKYGSLIWASLPCERDNSYYDYKGRPQPATPMKKCIEHYNKFLTAELAGVSNLHLKKGFLKEFEYSC